MVGNELADRRRVFAVRIRGESNVPFKGAVAGELVVKDVPIPRVEADDGDSGREARRGGETAERVDLGGAPGNDGIDAQLCAEAIESIHIGLARGGGGDDGEGIHKRRSDAARGGIAAIDLPRSAAEPQGFDESLTEVALDGGHQQAQSSGSFHVGTPI